MKTLMIALTFSCLAMAQNVGVKVDNAESTQENTTIEIRKGNKSSTQNQYEVTTGEENLEGDAAPLLKEARNNWKKACNDWKKEFREINKENSIVAMSCGTHNCATQSMETVCTSKATYKVRVKVN